MSENSVTGRQIFWAFALLVVAVVLTGNTPLLVAGLWGHELPDSLISNSDKVASGLIGILGTLVGLSFRRQPGDNIAAENTGKAFSAIAASANAAAANANNANATTPQPVTVVNDPDNPVPVEGR